MPTECNTKHQCLVCSEEKCCTGAHSRQSRLAVAGRFLFHSRQMFAAALGIELVCISFAELGENAGFYIFGFNPAGIAIAYVMGYALAGAATFVIILGRRGGDLMGCCSVEHRRRKGFAPNLAGTLHDFAAGAKRFASLHKEPELKSILRAAAIILVTAESACILVAETVDLVLYQYSILLSIPLALFAGAFTIVAPAAYKRAKLG